MRFIGTFAFAAALGVLSACGDNSVVTVPPDGSPPGGFPPDNAEGGNVIFEFIYFDTELQAAFGLPTGVTTLNRVMAYFMDHQTPEANPLPSGGLCTNLEATRGWPLFVGDPHVDLDVGSLTITGKNASDEDVAIAVAKHGAGIDAIGRPHDIFYQALNPGAEAFVGFDRPYTVKLGGSGIIPATTFEDTIFMSGPFDVKEPGLEDNGPLVAGTDFRVGWTPGTSANLPAGDDVLGVTWLVDTNGSPTHICPTLHHLGEFTIPGAAITEYRAVATSRGTNPDKMILLRNAIVHRQQRLPNGEPNNIRRIDMLSVNCWAQLMDVSAALVR